MEIRLANLILIATLLGAIGGTPEVP